MLDGSGAQTQVTLWPHLRGRTIFPKNNKNNKQRTFSNSEYEWEVNINPASRVFSATYGLTKILPDSHGLESRERIIKHAPSATAMWTAARKANGGTDSHHGPEYLGLRHPQVVALIDMTNSNTVDLAANANVHLEPRAFSTLRKIDESQQRQARAALTSSLHRARQAICPNDEEGLWSSVSQNKGFRKAFKSDSKLTKHQLAQLPFFQAAVKQFRGSNDVAERIPLLSQYVVDLKTFDYGFLCDHFDCGRDTVWRARIHAMHIGPGKPYSKMRAEVFRFSPETWAELHI